MPEELTVEEVLRRANLTRDPNQNHLIRAMKVELLWLDVLRAVADGHPQSAKLAAAALKTREVEDEC
jgi:hypothetical protein